jgi:hypothetical protein
LTKGSDGSVAGCCSCPMLSNASRAFSVWDIGYPGGTPSAVELVSTIIRDTCTPRTVNSAQLVRGMAASFYTQFTIPSAQPPALLSRPLVSSVLTVETLGKLTQGCSQRQRSDLSCNASCK